MSTSRSRGPLLVLFRVDSYWIMGKVIEEGLGDVQEAVDIAFYMAGEGRQAAEGADRQKFRKRGKELTGIDAVY